MPDINNVKCVIDVIYLNFRCALCSGKQLARFGMA